MSRVFPKSKTRKEYIMKVRILSLILAMFMCTAILVSCKSSSDSAETTGKQTEGVTVDDPEITKVNDYVENLAMANKLDGETFVYVGGGQQAEFDEETGNIENDALYKRQRDLEDMLGIDWVTGTVQEDANSTTKHAVIDSVKRSVMANTKDYDLVAGTLLVVGQPLFNGQCLEDVSQFSTLNLDADWWPATLRDTHSLAGKLYFLTGPIMTSYYSDGGCILFNKAVAEDYGIEDPYAYVNAGTWTFDKMVEVASAIPVNPDGAGAYRYGDPSAFSILYGLDYKITKFNDEGVPYVDSSLPQELSDIADKVSVIMGDNTTSAHTRMFPTIESVEEKYGKDFEDLFADGSIFFYFGTTGTAAALREKDVEFGVVPVPKADNAQKDYRSYADAWGSLFCYVPVCTRNIATTDVVTEAMAALSLKHIKPAYYDKILKGRSTHDTDSREMIDIIMKTKIYDIVDIYSLGDINRSGPFVSAIEKAVVYDPSSFATDYTIYSKMGNNQIKKIMTHISK